MQNAQSRRVERVVARRRLIFSGTAALLGLVSTRPSDAAAYLGSLSVRPTIGGPLTTPADELFIYSELRTPNRQPTSIQIDGLVNTPTRYDISDLGRMPHIEQLQTLECFVNTAGGPLIYTTHFKGVPLTALLHQTGVKPEARAARVETTDGHGPFQLPFSELRRPGAARQTR